MWGLKHTGTRLMHTSTIFNIQQVVDLINIMWRTTAYKLDHIIPVGVTGFSTRGTPMTPLSPLMTTTTWCWLQREMMGKQRLYLLPPSIPPRNSGGKITWFRKPLPIVLLPSLVVVSTVWFTKRAPLFSYCCTRADLSALMFWQIVSKSHHDNLLFLNTAATWKT